MWCDYCDNENEVCPYCKRNTDYEDDLISTYPKYPVNRIKEYLPVYADHYLDDVEHKEDLFEENYDSYIGENHKQPSNKWWWKLIITIVLINLFIYFYIQR